jgi:2-polyprenyl-3-methyl-5-hydroxy-6-metoxy-1,4-benzoquinol methylase
MAGESHGIHVDVAAIEDYPRDQFFDVATAIGVLEHVIDPKSMLTHMHRLLAPGGLMFIYTPVWGMYDVVTSFLARASQGRFTLPIDRRINAFHLQIFPKNTLIRLVQSLGLKIVTCDVVCEYNLPVELYLQSLGINQQRVRKIVTKTSNTLIDRKLFFRNNMRLIAQKTWLGL